MKELKTFIKEELEPIYEGKIEQATFEAFKKHTSEINEHLSKHFGVDVKVNMRLGKYYAGEIIYITSNNLLEHFGELGKFMFKDINLASQVVTADKENLWGDFDFKYNHPNNGGSNGIDVKISFHYNIEKDEIKWRD